MSFPRRLTLCLAGILAAVTAAWMLHGQRSGGQRAVTVSRGQPPGVAVKATPERRTSPPPREEQPATAPRARSPGGGKSSKVIFTIKVDCDAVRQVASVSMSYLEKVMDFQRLTPEQRRRVLECTGLPKQAPPTVSNY